jgi:hypothetical protein
MCSFENLCLCPSIRVFLREFVSLSERSCVPSRNLCLCPSVRVFFRGICVFVRAFVCSFEEFVSLSEHSCVPSRNLCLCPSVRVFFRNLCLYPSIRVFLRGICVFVRAFVCSPEHSLVRPSIRVCVRPCDFCTTGLQSSTLEAAVF